MGKKFMLVATLVGVLSLGACVDDKESASVEKIRNAKAEQLLSIAALNEAEAYAKKVLADADAALKAVEARLKEVEIEQLRVQVERAKVQVDIEKLLLELKEVEVEQERIELEKRRTQLAIEEANLEKAQFDVEREKAQLAKELAGLEEEVEAALLTAKASLLTAQNSYQTALDGANAAEITRLKTLLTAYTTAVNDLITYKNDLAKLNRELIELEYNLVDVATAKEKDIVRYNNQIAYYETQKATYEKYSTVDKAEAKKAWDIASSENTVLNSVANTSYQKVNQLTNELNNVNDWLYGSAYYTKLQNVFTYQTYGGKSISYRYVDGVGYYGYEVTDAFEITTWIPMFTGYVDKPTTVEYTHNDQKYGDIITYYTITDFYTVQKTGFESYIAAYEKYIEDNQQESYDNLKEAYDNAKDAEAEAEDAAKKAPTDGAKVQAYKDAHDLTVNRKSSLDNYFAYVLKPEQERLAKVKEAYAFITSAEQTAAVKEKVDAYNKLAKEISDWTIQNAKDKYAANLKSAEVNALRTIYNNATDIAFNIDDSNYWITYYERLIEDLSAIETKEEAIKLKEVFIANKEAEIEAKKIEVAKAKAAFDAASEAAAAANE